VTVKGLIMETTEGVYLWDWHESSAKCDELAKRGIDWPSDIYIVLPESLDEAVKKNLDSIRTTIREDQRHGRIDGYVATVTGRLDARMWTRIKHVSEQLGYTGNGYGNAGACPAKIDVINISEIHLVPEEEIRRAYPSNRIP
jgi:hypothetical protein